MKTVLGLLIGLLLSTTLLAFESEISSVGYYRLQTPLDSDKSDVCFKAVGASSKYRLGNECETWMELGVTQDVKFDNDVKIHNQIRPAFLGQNNEAIDFLRFDEFYSEIFNTFDNSVSFWVGRRYYKRYDSHMSDYWFFNMSGDGLGMSDLDIGGIKLSYSFMFDQIDPENVDGDDTTLYQSHDIRFVKNTQRAKMTLFLNYMRISANDFNSTHSISANNGYAIGLMYEDSKIFQELFDMKGNSINGLFYGKGAAKNAGVNSAYLQKTHQVRLIEDMIEKDASIEDSQTIRFINYNTFENDTLGIMSNFVIEYKDDEELSGDKQRWLSFGLRPYWFLHKNSRLTFEAGYDNVKDLNTDETYSLSKFTSALEFAFDKGVWERPVLRIYHTYATWSDNSVGLIGGEYYKNENNGYNTGIQIEYWW